MSELCEVQEGDRRAGETSPVLCEGCVGISFRGQVERRERKTLKTDATRDECIEHGCAAVKRLHWQSFGMLTAPWGPASGRYGIWKYPLLSEWKHICTHGRRRSLGIEDLGICCCRDRFITGTGRRRERGGGFGSLVLCISSGTALPSCQGNILIKLRNSCETLGRVKSHSRNCILLRIAPTARYPACVPPNTSNTAPVPTQPALRISVGRLLVVGFSEALGCCKCREVCVAAGPLTRGLSASSFLGWLAAAAVGEPHCRNS